jgi:hypothetical protein
MIRLFPVVILCSMAMAQSPVGHSSLQVSFASAPTTYASAATAANAPNTALPAIPKGRSTVIGGEIKDVDPVQDQFTLKVFGGKKMKVLFDERTEVYRDGQRIGILDLKPEDHASIQTTLDGTTVFALKIHMLSQMPEGETRGQVTSYNAQTGDLTLKAALSQQSLTLNLPAGTPIARVGQMASVTQPGGALDLRQGALIDVRFKSTTVGHASVTHVDVVAVPGSAFTFRGNLANLDAHTGRMVITDPIDNQTYPISFDALRLPVSKEIKVGSPVTAVTEFDGTKYVASAISTQ